MATEPRPQRSYRAACPNCGAPVDFRSPASAFAVCSYCQSSIVRDGEVLRRIGQSAELFDDHSPLQLGAGGRYQGEAFSLVGRLQYRYEEGTWNEWHALFDSGRSGWLSEDNGRYVFAFDLPPELLAEALPAAADLHAGEMLRLDQQVWSVASVTRASLVAAQGNCPTPVTGRDFVVADLRNTRDQVGTLDYSAPDTPRWSVGQAVPLGSLALQGLADGQEKTLAGRSLNCPSCGTALTLQLDSTQSIVCPQCKAVVDVSGGIGADLAHYAQDNPDGDHTPQIPLGTVGTLALGLGSAVKPLPWQVVGYVERCELDEDEQSFWREYLLYHRAEGFAFLVDAEDGWSWSAPITGVPERAGNGVKYQGVVYRKLYDYRGQITYVLGEFYWRLSRGETTSNTDYQGTGQAADHRINREQTRSGNTQEVVWSAGRTLDAETVRLAFRLAPTQAAALRRDAAPTALNPAGLLGKLFFWGFLLVVLLMLFRCDGDDDCDSLRSSYGESSQEYRSCMANRGSGRSGGGSFGGFSSGGSHK